MIVADANLIAYYYLPGPLQPVAQKILEKDPAWFVPPIMPSEFRNILIGFVRAKKISKTDAIELAAAVELAFRPRTKEVSAALIMDFAYTSGCSAYDAEYVALAQTLKTRLVTNDRAILKAFPSIATAVEDFSRVH